MVFSISKNKVLQNIIIATILEEIEKDVRKFTEAYFKKQKAAIKSSEVDITTEQKLYDKHNKLLAEKESLKRDAQREADILKNNIESLEKTTKMIKQ